MYKLLTTISFVFVILQFSNGQNDSIVFSGTYKQASFEDFVLSVEKNTEAKFFYKYEWISELRVDAAGIDLNLSDVLIDIFASSDLKFHIDKNKNVIIYHGAKIASQLPTYETYANGSSQTSTDSNQELTDAERKYNESRKVAELELISVGSKINTDKNKASVVRGRLTDETTGEPLLGATVYIKELGLGAATDVDGYFNLALNPGKYLVVANCLSMRERNFYLQVYSDGTISIPLEKELINIREVSVTANRNDNVKGMQMGYERLTTKSMKEIPAVLGEKDLLKVAQMLPGVQSAGEGASGLNVRGGTADQNLFYINKLPVYNTSHLFGFFTAFNPDIVNDFTLYKSNIPANFGGRASSVFDISTRQGNKKEFFGQGGISPVTAHAAIEGPIVKDKTSFVLSYRGSYSDWILSRLDNIDLKNSNASFYDIAGVVNTSINNKNTLKFFAYNSHDQFSLASSDDYKYSNAGSTLRWKHFFSPSLTGDFTGVYSQYGFGHTSKTNPSEAYSHNYLLNHTELNADFMSLTGSNHRILFGYSGILYNLKRGDILPFGEESTRIPISLGDERGVESAVYISDEFAIFPRLTALIGLRYSLYTYLGPADVNEYFSGSPIDNNSLSGVSSYTNNEIVKTYHGPEPRLAFNYKLGIDNSLKISYNRTRQYIFMLSNTIAISPTDQWKLADYHTKPPIADQVSLGYYHDFPEKGIITSFEVYKKWTQNIVEYKDGVEFISAEPTEQQLLQGRQNSYGIELMLKKNTGKLSGWISYSYARSFVQVASAIATEQINSGEWYPSNFDRPHSLNLVSNIRSNRRLSFSTNLVYSTGRPITYPVAAYDADGVMVYLYSDRNKYQIPDYFRIDLSVNLEGNLLSKKWIHSYWMLNVYNLTGRRNAYSIYFENGANNKPQGYKLSVFGQPIITLSWNFKFGNYASE
jgi:hypothetical protein